MRFLRTAPTGRLLAAIAGILVAIAAGTAIAVAAAGSGPVPKRESLAAAIHGALGGPAVKGISADVTFTNNLIGASNFTSDKTDPLLQGASGRLWLSSGHHFRLELQSNNGDAQVVVNGSSFWVSDPFSNTVYEGTIPAGTTNSGASNDTKDASAAHGIPSIAKIQSYLSDLVKHVNVSSAIPGDIAGQAAYTVRVTPKHDGGLLGAAELAWDSVRGVPLRIAIYARNNPTPVLALAVTNISYGSVSPSVFNITPPAGSSVVKIATPSHSSNARSPLSKLAAKRGRHAEISGVAAVAGQVPFTLVAPNVLIGLPRHGVSLLDMAGARGALVTYGEGLGGIAVIEQAQSAKAAAGGLTSSQGQNGQPSLSLPTVSIDGATGQELDTPLGTVLRFNRAGVSYTVIGSVPAAAADLAARAL